MGMNFKYLNLKSRLNSYWSSYCGSVVTNLTSKHEDGGLILGPTQWVKDLVLP